MFIILKLKEEGDINENEKGKVLSPKIGSILKDYLGNKNLHTHSKSNSKDKKNEAQQNNKKINSQWTKANLEQQLLLYKVKLSILLLD